MFESFFHGLCALLYPSCCVLCKIRLKTTDKTQWLCAACQETIELNRPPFCRICSRHIADVASSTVLCHECRKTTYHFDCAWAATIYNKSMKQLIHFFKYRQKTYLRSYFSRLMTAFLHVYQIDLACFEAAVPIPLHPSRARERGYNQSQLLLEGLLSTVKIPILKNSLIRIKNTPNQALLGKKDRWTNIRGAFRIKSHLSVNNKSILIVDDLLTTGATTSEAARLLKDAGAKKVGVFTLAIGS